MKTKRRRRALGLPTSCVNLVNFIKDFTSEPDFVSRGSINVLPLIKIGNTTIKMPCDEDSRGAILPHAIKAFGVLPHSHKRW
jgi:hypothetical protein